MLLQLKVVTTAGAVAVKTSALPVKVAPKMVSVELTIAKGPTDISVTHTSEGMGYDGRKDEHTPSTKAV